MVCRSALVLGAAALFALSGCGGSSAIPRSDYDAAIVSTRDRVDSALAHITQATSKDDLLNRMVESAGLIDQAAGDLDDTGSAKGFEEETKELVEALEQLAVDLEATSNEIRDPDFQKLLQGTQGISFDSWTKANRVLAQLRKRGVKVEPIARH